MEATKIFAKFIKQYERDMMSEWPSPRTYNGTIEIFAELVRYTVEGKNGEVTPSGDYPQRFRKLFPNTTGYIRNELLPELANA